MIRVLAGSSFLLLLAGLESVLLQTLGLEGIAFQTPLACVVLLGLREPLQTGAWMLLICLIPVEWLVVGPAGYYGFGLVLVYLGLRSASPWLAGAPIWLVALVSIGAIYVHGLVMMGLLLAFQPDPRLLGSIFWQWWYMGLICALTLVPLGYLFRRSSRIGVREKSRLLKA